MDTITTWKTPVVLFGSQGLLHEKKRCTRDAHLLPDRSELSFWQVSDDRTPATSKEHVMQITRIVGIAGMSCLMVSPALAQSQNSPPQNPSHSPPQSGSSTDRSTPPDPSTPNRPLSSNRGNQNVQSPRENQDVQSPRENQNVQSRGRTRMSSRRGTTRTCSHPAGSTWARSATRCGRPNPR